MKANALLCTIFLMTTACSNTYRTVDAGLSTDTLMQYLSEASSSLQSQSQSQSQTVSGGSSVDAATLAADHGTTIYFAHASTDPKGNFGPVASVLAFDDLSFLGLTNITSQSPADVGAVRVFFLDNPNFEGGRQDILIVGVAPLTDPTAFQYVKFEGRGQLDAGEFNVTFAGADGTSYSLRTFDVDGESLGANIQLKVYTADGTSVGKFSILAGFQ